MHPTDEKRERRELELWLAKRGPDYSDHEREVAANNAYIQRGHAATAEALKRYRAAERAGELDEGQER